MRAQGWLVVQRTVSSVRWEGWAAMAWEVGSPAMAMM